MSARRHFGIILVLYCISLSYSYRLLESNEDLKTCPALNKDIIFEEPHLNNNQRELYNVHKIPRRHHFNWNKHEIQPENWLLRIIRIKTIGASPSPKVQEVKDDKPMDGFAQRLFNILRQTLNMEEPSYKHKNEQKTMFVFKKNPFPPEHHIVKREPVQYNYM
ncbi:uncharacterized protein LOC120454345 [Drosophila santomea]|uniref:uncharacterized protein LOC120454345 n=1 Tax=Drosophila santomea TaxID=129105 RepID=UPI0019545FBF|nr:uncharacterized protein LOC120454345 [Drosophila santomea]